MSAMQQPLKSSVPKALRSFASRDSWSLIAATTPVFGKLKVSGVGFLRDRELRRSLLLLLGSQRGATFDANAIEDAR